MSDMINEPVNESKFGIGKGITITTGFDVATQLPLDSRSVVSDLEALVSMPDDVKYEGLLVYVVDDNKLYQWKRQMLDNGLLSDIYTWGPIESEIGAQELLDLSEIDFTTIPMLILQKNKENFFPMTHEDAIFVDQSGNKLSDKYQVIYDETLNTENKTIAGSVNEINTKLEDSINEFKEEITKTLNNLKQDVTIMEADLESLMREIREEIDRQIAELRASIEDTIAELKSKFEADIEKMLQDLDNSILTDEAIDNFMRQIRQNLSDLNNIV